MASATPAAYPIAGDMPRPNAGLVGASRFQAVATSAERDGDFDDRRHAEGQGARSGRRGHVVDDVAAVVGGPGPVSRLEQDQLDQANDRRARGRRRRTVLGVAVARTALTGPGADGQRPAPAAET